MARLELNAVSKIFGDSTAARAALSLMQSGASREAIRDSTGCTVAVRDISFTVDHGELFTIVGLSGSGKSTLVRCINRLVEPTSGTISLDGVDVTNASASQLRGIRQKKISMVFQHFALLPHKTVLENVEYGLRVAGTDLRSRRERSHAMIDVVGLGQWADAFPDELSGGMRQRVGIARALACDPEVLLMDEPFGALDPLIRRDMQQELRSLQSTLNKSIIFITHDLHEAMELGDRVAVMRDGEFVQLGRPEEILTNPADAYVSDFIRGVERSKFVSVGVICRPAASIREAELSPSALRKIGADPVWIVDGENVPRGIISPSKLGAGPATVDTDIGGLIGRDFGCVAASTRISATYGLIERHGLLAVVADDGGLIGQFSARDLTAYLANPPADATHPSTNQGRLSS